LVLYSVSTSPGLFDARLLISRDGGDSFEVAGEWSEIRGATYDGDGRLWVAAREGLYGSDEELVEFEQTSEATELGCAVQFEGELLVCGHYAGVASARFGVGAFDADDERFASWLDFSDVDALVACAEGSPARVACAQPWVDWKAEMLAPAPAAGVDGGAGGSQPGRPWDAGSSPDPGADSAAAAAPPRQATTDDSGCALGAPPRHRWGGTGASVIAVLAWWRRRRRWRRKGLA
jgi:hypothetical protein